MPFIWLTISINPTQQWSKHDTFPTSLSSIRRNIYCFNGHLTAISDNSNTTWKSPMYVYDGL